VSACAFLRIARLARNRLIPRDRPFRIQLYSIGGSHLSRPALAEQVRDGFGVGRVSAEYVAHPFMRIFGSLNRESEATVESEFSTGAFLPYRELTAVLRREQLPLVPS
jgi:hypothetical protein